MSFNFRKRIKEVGIYKKQRKVITNKNGKTQLDIQDRMKKWKEYI